MPGAMQVGSAVVLVAVVAVKAVTMPVVAATRSVAGGLCAIVAVV